MYIAGLEVRGKPKVAYFIPHNKFFKTLLFPTRSFFQHVVHIYSIKRQTVPNQSSHHIRKGYLYLKMKYCKFSQNHVHATPGNIKSSGLG